MKFPLLVNLFLSGWLWATSACCLAGSGDDLGGVFQQILEDHDVSTLIKSLDRLRVLAPGADGPIAKAALLQWSKPSEDKEKAGEARNILLGYLKQPNPQIKRDQGQSAVLPEVLLGKGDGDPLTKLWVLAKGQKALAKVTKLKEIDLAKPLPEASSSFKDTLFVARMEDRDARPHKTFFSSKGGGNAIVHLALVGNFTAIPAHFLQELPSLETVTIMAEKLEAIEEYFAVGTKQLKAIVIDAPKLKVIGYTFAEDSSVETVKLPPAVASIGMNFLSRAAKLSDLDLSKLTALKQLGETFLAGVVLAELDLSQATSLQTIPNFFLPESTVELVKLPGSITDIGESFLRKASFERLEFSTLPKIRTIASRFMMESTFGEFDCRDLAQVTKLPDYFMAGARGRAVINADQLIKVTAIGDGVFQRFKTITDRVTKKESAEKINVNLAVMTDLGSVGSNFGGFKGASIKLTVTAAQKEKFVHMTPPPDMVIAK